MYYPELITAIIEVVETPDDEVAAVGVSEFMERAEGIPTNVLFGGCHYVQSCLLNSEDRMRRLAILSDIRTAIRVTRPRPSK